MLIITFIFSLILGFISLIMCAIEFFDQISCCKQWRSWRVVRITGILTLISAAIFAGSILGMNTIEKNIYEGTSQTAEYELVSIQDNSQIDINGSGGIFYVYASMDTNEVYTFYYELENGGYKLGKIASKNVVIYEKDDCTPLIVEYTTYRRADMNRTIENILTFGIFRESEKSYEIFVPKGTIAQNYNFDAQ